MSTVKIADNLIWPSHIEGNDSLVQRIMGMHEGEIFEIEVDGFVGFWQKMKRGKDGRLPDGIKPRGDAKKHWLSAQRRRGTTVSIKEIPVTD